mmetsp:Transcript_94442/g.225000  ORF Transcript_94442/g.225000 Transcript_94442/m.225000 type:complete len:597 (-) Transcript_94442:80-1870(-)
MDADTAKADEGSDEVYFVSVSYRGVAYEVPVQGDDHLASIFDFVQEALDFPRENCKLICKGKMLRPDNDGLTVSEAGLAPGSKVMLVASSAKDVSFVQSNRSDPLVKGFAEEERDEQSRRKRARAALSAWGTKQDPEFNFGSIKAEFKYSEPPPYEAERLLQRLATDPGIIEIMKTRKFKVGVLTEMSPVEAQDRMAKRGTPNMDLLGYNQNYGGMIVLRLRTDSLKGFRPYHDLINTLIHEMTHNVWGPHDHNFWKLFGELKAQYMRFHRFWSHGGRAADSNAAGQFQGFESEAPESGANFGHVLGGAGALSAEERRARALEAAQARSEPQEEPASFVPNFLASKGGWMFLCPCGEMHEVSSETKSQLESAFSGNFEGCLMGEATQDTTPAPEETEPREAEAETEPTNQEVQPETLRAEEQEEAEAEAEMKPVMTEEVQAETGEPEKVSPELSPEHEPAPSASTADPEELPWDLAELEAQGLDGAALWLQRFGAAMQRSQGAAKGPALETLLKLVKNVVSSPGEQKFRRVRAENPAVRARLMSVEGAESMLVLLGFEAATEGGERVFLLSDHGFDLAKLRMGQELLEVELERMAK